MSGLSVQPGHEPSDRKRGFWAHLLRRGNVWLSSFFLVGSIALIIWTTLTSIGASTSGPVGPWGWPRAILVILALGALIDVLAEARGAFLQSREAASGVQQRSGSVGVNPLDTSGPLGKTEEVQHDVTDDEPTVTVSPAKLLIAILLMIGYVFGVLILGFLIASFVFALLFVFLGGFRRVIWAPVVAVVASLGITYLFVRVVYISLPLGIGPFQNIEVAIYHALHLF
ncbi:MAG: tripartite tricarboxylate transporter TctB family protein [Sciscionella sp.]